MIIVVMCEDCGGGGCDQCQHLGERPYSRQLPMLHGGSRFYMRIGEPGRQPLVITEPVTLEVPVQHFLRAGRQRVEREQPPSD
jgi:hypothetical protein